MKGQGEIESPIVTVLLLIFIAIFTVVAFITLLGVGENQRKYSTELVTGSVESITFTEGLANLQMGSRSVIEQALHTMLAGSPERADSKLNAIIPNLARQLRIELYEIRILRGDSVLDKISAWPQFCGDLSAGVMAFCERSCSAGRTAGTATVLCGSGEQCCTEGYDFENNMYRPYLSGVTPCGPDSFGRRGVCQATCSSGRVEMADISNRCERPTIFLRDEVCCRPMTAAEFETKTLGQTSQSEFPLLYNNTIGMFSIALGKVGIAG